MYSAPFRVLLIGRRGVRVGGSDKPPHDVRRPLLVGFVLRKQAGSADKGGVGSGLGGLRGLGGRAGSVQRLLGAGDRQVAEPTGPIGFVVGEGQTLRQVFAPLAIGAPARLEQSFGDRAHGFRRACEWVPGRGVRMSTGVAPGVTKGLNGVGGLD
jgi:hypothetical protein